MQKKRLAPATRRVSAPSGRSGKIFIVMAFIFVAIVGFYFISKYVYPLVITGTPPELIPLVKDSVITEKPSIPVAETRREPVVNESTLTPIQKKIQVEVLNGCGVQGIAKELSDKLKALDYDVVNSGNYLEQGKLNWDVPRTRLIDQVGELSQARDLADRMGVDHALVESFDNPSPIADITIVIGKDYSELIIFQ